MYDGFWDKREQMLQNSYAVCTFLDIVHALFNSGIPKMWTYTNLFLTVTEWIFLPPISYIYIFLYFTEV